MNNVYNYLVILLFALIGLTGCRSPEDGAKAQETLLNYLTHLHRGQYANAAELYGGPYDILMDWNPDVAGTDHARLLEHGCAINGLQCLKVAEVSQFQELEPGVFQFYVSFENPDGSRFEIGSQDTQSLEGTAVFSFPFTVVKSEAGFLVQELPVYLP